MYNLDPVFIGLATLGISKYVMLNKISKEHHKRKQLVARLSRITLFPVKSMRGVDVTEAECTFTGLKADGFRDRCFMVTDSKYDFVSARKLSKMSTIVAQIKDGKIHLSASGVEPISVPVPMKQEQQAITAIVWMEELEAVDCGDEVAKWLCEVLQKDGLRLVYHADNMKKRRCDMLDTPWHKMSKPHDQVAFQDGFPYMLLSEGSLTDLNTHLKKPVSMNNFRPNLVVEGCDPYDEDVWDKVFIGDVEFFNIKPCQRCIMTTVDPKAGRRDPDMEPLRTLKRYRPLPKDAPQFWVDNPVFGVNLVAVKPGVIRVGDAVFVTRK